MTESTQDTAKYNTTLKIIGRSIVTMCVLDFLYLAYSSLTCDRAVTMCGAEGIVFAPLALLVIILMPIYIFCSLFNLAWRASEQEQISVEQVLFTLIFIGAGAFMIF